MAQSRLSATTFITHGILALVAVSAFMLPDCLPQYATAVPMPGGNMVRLYGKLWDLEASHPDMDVTPSEGFGVYAGLLAEELGLDGRPVFEGDGNMVIAPAVDIIGNPIAASMANRAGVINFEIVEGEVIVNEDFAAVVQVLGVDIATFRVTFRIAADSAVYEPFGPYSEANAGNINDEASPLGGNGTGPNPRSYTLPTVYDAGTVINVSGQSWLHNGSGSDDIEDEIPLSDVPAATILAAENAVPGIVIDEAGRDDPDEFFLRGNVGSTRYEVEIDDWTDVEEVKTIKSSGGTLLAVESIYDSLQLIVLRDGDPVPPNAPAPGQLSLAEYIADYVDESDNTIDLESYQVIYLYELYTRDPNSIYYDFQDMVVILSLAKPGRIEADTVITSTCGPQDDLSATLSATPSNGGIQDAGSFSEWYTDVLGTNLSGSTFIDLYEQGDGTFLFDDQLDNRYSNRGGYFPADGLLLDNGGGGHNDYFTTKFEAIITADTLADQFLEVTSDGDLWVFIDDQLVIDMGGIHDPITQRIDLSRLCLINGSSHKLTVFRAQRFSGLSRFRLWTNLEFSPMVMAAMGTGQFD